MKIKNKRLKKVNTLALLLPLAFIGCGGGGGGGGGFSSSSSSFSSVSSTTSTVTAVTTVTSNPGAIASPSSGHPLSGSGLD